MSNSFSYETKPGDTYESVSRQFYGTKENAGLIAEANPDLPPEILDGFLIPGLDIVIPVIQAPPLAIAKRPKIPVDEVILFIDNKRFRFWSEISFKWVLDGVSQISFLAPFTPGDPVQQAIFKPFTYKPIRVEVGGEIFFTGTAVAHTPNATPDAHTISVSAYATCGVLQDCTMPVSSYPLEFNDLNLKQIATQLCKPFGIAVIFKDKVGSIFDRLSINPGKEIFGFLATLAKQRGLIIGNDESGNLVFQKSVSVDKAKPVAVVTTTTQGLVSIKPDFQQQAYYSHISGIEPMILGFLGGGEYTAKNTHLKGILRPHTFKVADSIGGDVSVAVDAKMGRMFGNMAAYTLEFSTWRDPQGDLWRPNTLISVHSPSAMIYNPYTFIIREVSFSRSGDKKIALMTVVMPGVFEGKIPEVLPWD